MRLRSLGPALTAVVLLITIAVACGSEDGSLFGSSSGDDGGGGGGGGTSGNSFGGSSGSGEAGGGATITALTIDPPTATLDLTTSPYPTQAFTATATYANGTKGPANVGWTASNTPVGTIDRNGLYTPRGALGGVVTITASAPGATATATLTVRLHQGNASTVDEATRTGLLGATTEDASVVWTYPYDNTAFPRGLNAPELMWNNGADGDEYLIHLESGTYELQAFTPASTVTAIAGTTPAGARKFQFDPAVWTSFVESSSGAATLTVTRKSGAAFTKLVSQSWSIASRSMSGTIYYWAINRGQVVRIKPGATAPDAFLGPAFPPLPNKGQTSLYCPSCHTASADGSRMALSTGPQPSCNPDQADVWSTLLDLGKSQPIFNGYETNNPPSQLTLAGLSADGKVAVENWALVRGCNPPPANTDSLVALPLASTTDTTLTHVTDSGLEGLVGSGHHTYFPVFSPDNKLFVYVDSESNALYALDWDPAGQKFGNRQELAPAGDTKIAYPTISPDHRWVVYQRGPSWGSLDTAYTGDLYAVDTLNPMHEIPLDTVNSSFSAAAGGARDQHRSYEPTFAPVASGGFFWLVFHTRRTYGNQLVDVPYVNGTEGSGTKQLWVAAIGVPGAGAATSDPSRPPFWLPGQDATTRNMRGYWVLDPCKADGASCVSGTDCCNGFCDTVDDGGQPICGKSSATCSQSGDRCSEDRDCCTLGDTCINHACSESQPK